MISRLYEQFSRNDSAMTPEKNFKLLEYEHMRIHDFMNTLRNFVKSVFAHISAKKFMLTESPDHML